MRVALYARYSSAERQKESSIDQQLRLLRDRADSEGWEVVASYEDKGLTGANFFRAGMQRLIGAVHAREIDIILTESIDRLSRDQEDIAYLYKRCQHNDIQMVTLLEGEITELHIGLKGTMSALYRKDLARRTHRGLEQRALEGESTGGLSYGYDLEPQYDAKKGRRVGGIRTINEEQAAIVRRIFTDYCNGKSPRKIAFELNAEGIPGPRGGTWSSSTIYGNRRRGTGLLLNELYRGVQIFNKQSFFKDPDTGRETGRLNDESKWIRTEVPNLRIIDPEIWEMARSKQRALADKGDFGAQRRPRKLFSFLLKCGECHGGFAKLSQSQYGCASRKNKGTCSNALTISERKLEHIVLGTLRDQLMHPEICEVVCVQYTEHLNRIRANERAALDSNRAELDNVERSIAKLVDAIKRGIDPVLIRDEINGLQQRKLTLQAALVDEDRAPVFIHPNMAHRYHVAVQDLIASLKVDGHREEAAELIRGMIEKVVLTPNEDRSDLTIDLHGRLAGILQMALGKEAGKALKPSALADLAAETEIEQIRLMANQTWEGAHSLAAPSLADGREKSDHRDPSSRNRWLGRQDSNLRMPVPKTGALPLGDAPAGGRLIAAAGRKPLIAAPARLGRRRRPHPRARPSRATAVRRSKCAG